MTESKVDVIAVLRRDAGDAAHCRWIDEFTDATDCTRMAKESERALEVVNEMVDVLRALHGYDSAEHADVSLLDAEWLWDRVGLALAACTPAKGENQ